MSGTCPTVKIEAENEQGFVIVNESDFDESQHVLFGTPKETAPAENDPVQPVVIEPAPEVAKPWTKGKK